MLLKDFIQQCGVELDAEELIQCGDDLATEITRKWKAGDSEAVLAGCTVYYDFPSSHAITNDDYLPGDPDGPWEAGGDSWREISL